MIKNYAHALPLQDLYRWISPLIPGLLLCCAISAGAHFFTVVQERIFSQAWLGALVLSIIIGTIIRSSVKLPAITNAGIRFSSKNLLEIAVALLGASLSLNILQGAGGFLIAAIAVIVAISLVGSYYIGRALGLSPKLATLIACGNSICGNSAIAAAAPAIGAKADDIAASIAFTAVLGVLAVLLMPLLPVLLGMSEKEYGIFAGLTVYAVPQVLAATAPIGTLAVQTGTIVKLIRVLMLGPVITTLAIIHGRSSDSKPSFQQMVPWFVIAFVLMAMASTFQLIPASALAPISLATNVLTLMAMSALGLSVDIRSLRHAGGKVITAASLSLILLCGLSLALLTLMAAI